MAKKPQVKRKATAGRVVREKFLKPGQRISPKRKKKAEAENKRQMPQKPVAPITVELPRQIADVITNKQATTPKQTISLSMAELLNPKAERKLAVVKVCKNAMAEADRVAFKAEMAELGVEVVFLVYGANTAFVPDVEMFQRGTSWDYSSYRWRSTLGSMTLGLYS